MLNLKKNWLLFVAIGLMLSSAMVSYFLVRQNEPRIAHLKTSLHEKQSLIRDIWSNLGQKEMKVNHAVLLLALEQNTLSSTAAITYYLSELSELKVDSRVSEILSVISKEKQKDIDYINDLYYEQLTAQNNLDKIEASNKRYSDLSFFLQIIGLALILLKREFPI